MKYGLTPDAGIELLADSSLLQSGRPLFVPDWASAMMGTAAVAVRVSRLGKAIAPQFAHRYWDAYTGCFISQGIDASGALIDRKALTRAHDAALALGRMQPKSMLDGTADVRVTLSCGHHEPCSSTLAGFADLIDQTLSQLSQYMTLKMGDLLCLSAGAGSPLSIDQVVTVSVNGTETLRTKIK